MALIAIATHDTIENKRTEYTRAAFLSLVETVDFKKHRLFISDNGSCDATKELYKTVISYIQKYGNLENVGVIMNNENIGTARAINRCIAKRRPGEHVVKIDNDVVVRKSGWVDEMEEAISIDKKIGIIGLKRKDLEQRPDHENPAYKSELIMLPHERGERWVVVEKSSDVMGTCVMHSSDLLDRIGGLVQPSLYGFDDVLACIRSRIAGFYNCFLPHFEIEHLDAGGDIYCAWKTKHSGEQWDAFHKLVAAYNNGEISIYHNPNE